MLAGIHINPIFLSAALMIFLTLTDLYGTEKTNK